ncbi:MAG: glycosyltransferase family 2 protein [Nitrospirae bacterium]|nr:glycosyltransferase family 2 protein [Nitrospirota bacterium]
MRDPSPFSLSVVFSFRNEQAVIPELIRRVEAALDPLTPHYELIFVNDASTDGSLDLLAERHHEDPHIKVITMSRRFGVYECLFAGLNHARGDAVIIMDADLQDPPEVIPDMVKRWREGADVVYTTRLSREGEPMAKMALTKLAYRTLRWASTIDLPVDSGDFKLLSRKVVAEFGKLGEKDPYFRGMVSWVGFRHAQVHYHREKRYAGKTQRSLFGGEPIKVFLAALASFSNLPLHLPLISGGVLFLAGLIHLAAIVRLVMVGGDPAAWSIIVCCLLLLTGIQVALLGLVALYVGRVLTEVRDRPRYIIESTIGLDPPSL